MKQAIMERISNWTEAACDLVLLNLLWLACCLPILTIGASTTAMHYVVRKMVSGERYTVWSSFWSSFRANWKQATVIWILMAAFALICCMNLYIGAHIGETLGVVCQIVGVLGLILMACAWTTVFPLLSRYTQKTAVLLKNAVIISLANPHIVLLGWAAALVFPALVLVKEAFLILSTPGWLLAGGGLPALTVQLLLRPVYARLERAKPTQNTTHGDGETENRL